MSEYDAEETPFDAYRERVDRPLTRLFMEYGRNQAASDGVPLRPFVVPLDRYEAALFVGWFGPIGVAAIYYALVARTETGLAVTLIAGSLVVFCSILVPLCRQCRAR